MGDRENGMIVVGDCSVDLVVVGGDVRVSMDVVGVCGVSMWCPWIRGGGV